MFIAFLFAAAAASFAEQTVDPAKVHEVLPPAFSDPKDVVQGALLKQLSEAEAQDAAADRDLQLVSSVAEAFYRLRNTASSSLPAALDRALGPLRAVYPDYRLHYRGAQDFCPIQRALSDARSSVLKRKIVAKELQAGVYDHLVIYSSMLMEYDAGKIMGQPLEKQNIQTAFLRALPKAPEPRLGFDELDYLKGDIKTDCD